MSFRTFILGLATSFGVAWLAIIVIPFVKMRNRPPIALNEAKDGATGIFFPKRTGRVADGALVYAGNGCYLCHTQLVRNTDAGTDMYRADAGGLDAKDGRDVDTRRETMPDDFFGERFAQIGVARMGPDLSNLGVRVEKIYAKGGDPAKWLYAHLYNPRQEPDRWKSNCPPYRFLFEEKKVMGNRLDYAMPSTKGEDMEMVPSSEARALVSYLLSLKKDQALPASVNPAPVSKKKG